MLHVGQYDLSLGYSARMTSKKEGMKHRVKRAMALTNYETENLKGSVPLHNSPIL